MGRMLGAHASDELDRPDLNKCPDCGCFFAESTCPLCGMECPEEMKAGNRKKVKPQKRRRGDSGRVTFISWYHNWWVIIIALIVAPILGIVLLFTSPHKKSLKIAVIVIAAAWTLLFSYGLFGQILKMFDNPVDTSLTKEEYIAACDEVSGESFYRSPDEYKDKFVKLTLTVNYRTNDYKGMYNEEKYVSYYICTTSEGFEIMVRDCSQDGKHNFVEGDVITVYGEGDGNKTIYNAENEPHEAPCVNGAYIVLNTK